MDKQQNAKKTVILIVILILVVIGLVGYLIYGKVNKAEHTSINSSEVNGVKTYSIKYPGETENSEFEYKLNDEFTVKLLLKNDGIDSFDIYVNDNYILTNNMYGEYINDDAKKINFYYIENYLVYATAYIDYTIYIIGENGTEKTIYELDDIEGMHPYDSFEIDSTGLTVYGSRFDTSGKIQYGDILLEQDDCTYSKTMPFVGYYNKDDVKKVSNDAIIEATYKFEYSNGKFTYTPVVSNDKTFEDVINETSTSYTEYCKNVE